MKCNPGSGLYSVDARDDHQSTPAHKAAGHGQVETLSWLIDNEADSKFNERGVPSVIGTFPVICKGLVFYEPISYCETLTYIILFNLYTLFNYMFMSTFS